MASSTLAERLKEALNDAGMTQMALEVAIDVSKGYVSRIVKGERLNVGPQRLGTMARILGVSRDWLAEGLGPKHDGIDPGLIAQRAGRLAIAANALGYSHEAIHQVLGSSFKGALGITDEQLLEMIRDAHQAAKGKAVHLRVVTDEEEEIRRTLAAGGASDEEIEREIAEWREGSNKTR